MQIGVAYYPEQWPEERWAIDAELMREWGIEVVRVGESAWRRSEQRRERIDTDWLRNAVDVLAAEGLKVIMCTPTAAPPQWLFNRHPSMLPQDADGRRWYCGSRRHVCLNNPAYHKYVRRIVTELAKRFAADPNVHAWQIDNELGAYGTAACYCDDCQQAFRHWLKRRYGTIDRLNKQWGTVFWSQGFVDWHEVPAPRRTPGGPHPSLALDYKRFLSATCRGLLIEQSQIIKDYGGQNVIITTNSPGAHRLSEVNQFSLAAEQDVAALDNYPGAASRLDVTAYDLDVARCAKRKPFWVMEQQAGATLMADCPCQPRPGQLRLWSYQAAARGAELISYFRWRTAPFGQEMHWYGMLNADGSPGRRCQELQRTIRELKERAHLWQGSMVEADVALLLDYDSGWALEAAPIGVRIDYFGHALTVYKTLRRMGAQVDVVAPEADLTAYRAAVAPMPFACTEAAAESLTTLVANGGSVVVTAPAGYKTPQNTTIPASPPGCLAELVGVTIPEHDVLAPGATNTVLLEGSGGRFRTGRFCCLLELHGAEVVGSYEEQYYAGSPAITCRTTGQGRAFLVGALCEAPCYEAVLRPALESAGARLCEWSSESVEVVRIKGSPERPQLMFVLNHSPQTVTLPLREPGGCEDVLTGRTYEGSAPLEGYGVMLLSM